MNNKNYIIVDKYLTNEIKKIPTRKQYYDEIAAFEIFLNHKSLISVTKEEAEHYKQYLKDYRYTKAGKKTFTECQSYSTSTIIKKLRILLTFYTHLQESNLVDENPFFYVEIPQQNTEVKETRLLGPTEIDVFFKAAEQCGERDLAIVKLMFTARMSPQEICAFNWGDFLEEYNGVTGILVSSRGQIKRTIALKNELKDYILGPYRISVNKEPGIILPEEREEPVFKNRSGKRISTTAAIRNIVYKISSMSGIKKQISPLDIGHTGAVVAIQEGATERQIKNHGNFSSITVAQKYNNANLIDYSILVDPACNLISTETKKKPSGKRRNDD